MEADVPRALFWWLCADVSRAREPLAPPAAEASAAFLAPVEHFPVVCAESSRWTAMGLELTGRLFVPGGTLVVAPVSGQFRAGGVIGGREGSSAVLFASLMGDRGERVAFGPFVAIAWPGPVQAGEILGWVGPMGELDVAAWRGRDPVLPCSWAGPAG
jgi:hypothetical protein